MYLQEAKINLGKFADGVLKKIKPVSKFEGPKFTKNVMNKINKLKESNVLECGCTEICECGDAKASASKKPNSKTLITKNGDMIIDKKSKKTVNEGIGKELIKAGAKIGATGGLLYGGAKEYNARREERLYKALKDHPDAKQEINNRLHALNQDILKSKGRMWTAKALDTTPGKYIEKKLFNDPLKKEVDDRIIKGARDARPSVAIPKFVKSLPDKARTWYKNDPTAVENDFISKTVKDLKKESYYEDEV